MAELKADHLCVTPAGAARLVDASLTLNSGELVALLGPNGAGKTTLLRAALGLEPDAEGVSRIDGVGVDTLSPAARARAVSYLPQVRPLAWPTRVRDVVALGRFAHGVSIGRIRGQDAEAVSSALSACDIDHLSERRTDTLSGGELARVHCARAFAAQAPLLVADEPVAALDPRHQFRVMDLIKSYVADGGGALVVLHDVALAAGYADRLIWMKGGRILADGSPCDTLSQDRLADVYGVRATVEAGQVRIDGAL